jgi:hypothetical protein
MNMFAHHLTAAIEARTAPVRAERHAGHAGETAHASCSYGHAHRSTAWTHGTNDLLPESRSVRQQTT